MRGTAASPSLSDEFDGPRACGPYELAPALDLINYVFRIERNPLAEPSRPENVAMGWENAHVYHPGNLQNVRIVCHRPTGRVVCSVGVYVTRVRTPRGEIGVGGISAVATHPDFRRHGLSSATMEDAHATMRAAGLQIGLLGTGIPHFYRRLGWERAGIQRVFVLDRACAPMLPSLAERGLEVRQEWRPYVSDIVALHNAKRFGTRRDAEHFTLLAERRADRWWVARRDGRPAAYAALRHGFVHEYGGAAQDVAALLRHVFEQLDDQSLSTTQRRTDQRHAFELSVSTPDFSTAAPSDDLPMLFTRLGFTGRLTYQGMVKILDAPGLFSALRLDDVSIERRDEGWRVGHAGKALDATEHQLVKLVFGPERFPDFAAERFPVPFYQWPLERV